MAVSGVIFFLCFFGAMGGWLTYGANRNAYVLVGVVLGFLSLLVMVSGPHGLNERALENALAGGLILLVILPFLCFWVISGAFRFGLDKLNEWDRRRAG
jgi:hypothetical protein